MGLPSASRVRIAREEHIRRISLGKRTFIDHPDRLGVLPTDRAAVLLPLLSAVFLAVTPPVPRQPGLLGRRAGGVRTSRTGLLVLPGADVSLEAGDVVSAGHEQVHSVGVPDLSCRGSR